MNLTTPLAVYVPDFQYDALLGIDPRSGIVGTPAGDRIHIYYEGNRYGSVNIVTYADRVYHAASRLVTRYPTVAQRLADPDHLINVGYFDGRRVDVQHAEALASWLELDEDQLDAELERSTGVAR